MRKRKAFTITLIFILVVSLLPVNSDAADEPVVKKKGKLWLIPVLSGAAFAGGVL
jgi:uncharacterized membrane protein